jgi:adenylate cyclase
MNEIERKYLLFELPNVPVLKRYTSERYLLQSGEGIEERITHVGGQYFYEQKRVLSDTERTRDRREISENDFSELRERAYGYLTRETLLISESPKVSIQVYKGEYAGLIRAEVEFDNKEEADGFMPYTWMGGEITGLRIARDSTLARMTHGELLLELRKIRA